jgi:hypothetical protein
MEFDLKTGAQGHVYFPKAIREVLGDKMKILPNAHAALIYPEGTTPQDLLNSLSIITADLKLRVKEEASPR